METRLTASRLVTILVLFLPFSGDCLSQRGGPGGCVACDTLGGVNYWNSSPDPLSDFHVRCLGFSPSYTICGGYSSNIQQVAHHSNILELLTQFDTTVPCTWSTDTIIGRRTATR